MNIKKLADQVLSGIDTLGYELDRFGITPNFNRHTAIAFVMAEQKRLEGELDSAQAKIDRIRYTVEKTRQDVENLVEKAADLALMPARTVVETVRARLN
ncbi:hypothetical protein AAIA72_13340 [Hahella sp. SMD15-11]|uniref:Uncharacterized protein n=1 Tax=Thermohahella caldifontis TaxID=3142973 RepID=A0AB39UUY3_9GAMM